MSLRLYNTRTRTKDAFAPLDPDKGVRMYVCGPTVYDFAHIGNARPVIVFDVLYRLLRHHYGPDKVKYARNITDVDDKINARAAEEGVPIGELTARTTGQFHADMAALGCLPPEVEPRATAHIDDMRAMIGRLVENGCAYVAEDHVLFDVSSRPDYGSLSRRPLDEMKAGARVEVAPYKRDPMDFVLWKPSKDGEPGWDSPCGIEAKGRPGWHIECSAMAARHLGETFDIHGGGIDLQFPHHENEVAQSCCANRTDIMANVWMHNGYLMVEGEKMSKSLGNFITVRGLLEQWPGEVIRFNMLRTHYRQPINWTESALDESFDIYFDMLDISEEYIATQPDTEFVASLIDDLNTPRAIARLFAMRDEAAKGNDDIGGMLRASLNLIGFAETIRDNSIIVPRMTEESSAFSDIFGNVSREDVAYALLSRFPKNYPLDRAVSVIDRSNLEGLEKEVDVTKELVAHASPSLRVGDAIRCLSEVAKINDLCAQRLEARKAKNFAEADRIRDELAGMGIQLKDSRDPETGEITTTWEIAR